MAPATARFPRAAPWPRRQCSQGVAVADFNNDGWLDAAVASNNGTIAIYSMTATGATATTAVRPATGGT